MSKLLPPKKTINPLVMLGVLPYLSRLKPFMMEWQRGERCRLVRRQLVVMIAPDDCLHRSKIVPEAWVGEDRAPFPDMSLAMLHLLSRALGGSQKPKINRYICIYICTSTKSTVRAERGRKENQPWL